MSQTKPLTIGALARAAGVGIETIRFYERRGLLLEPPRTAAGYRQYSAEAVDRLRFIRRAQGLGITQKLNELRRLKRALERLVGACVARAPTSDCPILEEIEDR